MFRIDWANARFEKTACEVATSGKINPWNVPYPEYQFWGARNCAPLFFRMLAEDRPTMEDYCNKTAAAGALTKFFRDFRLRINHQ